MPQAAGTGAVGKKAKAKAGKAGKAGKVRISLFSLRPLATSLCQSWNSQTKTY